VGGVNDDFWDDLLEHIRDQKLVTVVGPNVTLVQVDNTEQTLSSLIGQRLAEKYDLTMSPGMTMGEAVAMYLRERGRDEVELRLYRVINNIIRELDPAPADALRNLAAITDLHLFVTTTPDRLLAQAVNEVRFQGRGETRELTASSKRPTSEQPSNEPEPAASDTVVLSLFGQAASTRQYAIHEEDKLEWLHALLRDEASLPDWLAGQLRTQPMLFVGCEMPDWVGRFLLRMSSKDRLLAGGKQFFVVGSSGSYEPSLSDFFATYCRKPLVQRLEMEPTAFVAELRARWEKEAALRPPAAVGASGLAAPDAPTIFVSYMREDADAARQLRDAITELGGDVWLDKRRLGAGDAWENEISNAIRRARLFVPIISANTELEEEGYVFTEWHAAVKRSLSIMGRNFIVPVIVDKDYEGDPSRYRQIPPDFRRFHFGHAPAGDPDAELVANLRAEIRAMRRRGAA
jgi:TIR domain/SIR2-like domain